MLYLDTSALLKLYIREKGSEAVQAHVAAQDEPLPVWEMQEMELVNALRLKVFWKELAEAEAKRLLEEYQRRKARGFYYFPDLHRADLLAAFRELSRETMRLGCRTLDVLHVACAVQLAADEFLTFDERQRKLAVRAGLRTAALGRPS